MSNLFENLQLLSELAMSRADAIEVCMSLGKQFVNHFKEIYKKGINDADFKHHCQELQAWYDNINSIVLKSNNKKLLQTQKMDWFFTCGSSLEELFDNYDESLVYENFIIKLLSSNDLIVNILTELLKRSE